jgi:hypothetical protein
MADSSQAIEGYGCKCGFRTDDKIKFRTHLLSGGQKEKGTHKSLGRINLLTNEVIMGPWVERTTEERLASNIAKKSSGIPANSTKPTDVFAEATEVRFVPRVYTAPFSNIIICAMEAAQREWGWRKDMPLINFLDTVIYNFFKDRNIVLQSYTVNRPPPPEPAETSSDQGPDDETPGEPGVAEILEEVKGGK